MLTERLGRWAARAVAAPPWTDVYGLARTLLALATLGTLLASGPATLFHPAAGVDGGPQCGGPNAAALFCLAGAELGRWAGIALLLVVASGWRPAATALAHWWVTWSLHVSGTVTDGGDQVAAVLTLLLVPVALTDTRRWHWDPPDASSGPRRRVLARGALWLVRLQIAGIYLHAALAKLGRSEWADGTALYYWLGAPTFGLPPAVRWLTDPLLRSGPGVAALTWGVLLLELTLVLGLVAVPPLRRVLLVAGLAFHLGIAGMGLASFALTMCAALVLYLPPVETPLALAARVPRLLPVPPVRRRLLSRT